MSIVVSDTSPVRALANLGLLPVLQALFGDVIVPEAVARELSLPPDGQTGLDLAQFSFLKIMAVSELSSIERFLVDLDRGESEALALAIEVQADLLLIDEIEGRARAREEGLEIIGVLGVLLNAKKIGYVVELKPLLDQLQNQHRFFIARRIREEVLRLAGES
jgi:predicted nucleic acid-binding protein